MLRCRIGARSRVEAQDRKARGGTRDLSELRHTALATSRAGSSAGGPELMVDATPPDPMRREVAMSLARRVGLSLLTGYGAYPAGKLGDYIEELLPLPFSSWTNILIGALFGALVMGVRVPAAAGRAPRVLALIAGSILIYTLAVWLAVINYGPLNLGGTPSILASGALGALLATLAVVLIAPLHPDARIWLYAAAAGLIGGAVFHYTIEANVQPEALEALIIGSGYAVWQLL